jgi:hypothetical protein
MKAGAKIGHFGGATEMATSWMVHPRSCLCVACDVIYAVRSSLQVQAYVGVRIATRVLQHRMPSFQNFQEITISYSCQAGYSNNQVTTMFGKLQRSSDSRYIQCNLYNHRLAWQRMTFCSSYIDLPLPMIHNHGHHRQEKRFSRPVDEPGVIENQSVARRRGVLEKTV